MPGPVSPVSIPTILNPGLQPGPPPTGVGVLPPPLLVSQPPGAPAIGDREDIVPSELIVKSTEE